MKNLNITYKTLDTPTDNELELIEKWRNNPKIKPLVTVHRCDDDLTKKTSISMLIKEYADKEYTRRFLILWDGQPVGEINYQWNSRHLLNKDGKTAWVGILIGEDYARGKGLGFKAIQFLEKQIIKDKGNRIELGVFEFNKPALGLYKKLGYQEIGRVSELTFWNGKLRASIQLEKTIS